MNPMVTTMFFPQQQQQQQKPESQTPPREASPNAIDLSNSTPNPFNSPVPVTTSTSSSATSGSDMNFAAARQIQQVLSQFNLGR